MKKSPILSLQFRVLGFCSFVDGDVGVGVFLEGEEAFVTASALTRAASASAPCEVLACKALARATPRCANDRWRVNEDKWNKKGGSN
jgi:hypothetical protein